MRYYNMHARGCVIKPSGITKCTHTVALAKLGFYRTVKNIGTNELLLIFLFCFIQLFYVACSYDFELTCRYLFFKYIYRIEKVDFLISAHIFL